MGFGGLLESAADFTADGNGAGEEIDGAGLKGARRRGAEEFAGGHFESFECDIHGLELGFAAAHHGTERDKAQMLVEPKLASGAADDSEVVAFFDAVLP